MLPTTCQTMGVREAARYLGIKEREVLNHPKLRILRCPASTPEKPAKSKENSRVLVLTWSVMEAGGYSEALEQAKAIPFDMLDLREIGQLLDTSPDMAGRILSAYEVYPAPEARNNQILYRRNDITDLLGWPPVTWHLPEPREYSDESRLDALEVSVITLAARLNEELRVIRGRLDALELPVKP